jgi:hypothetical protein
MNDDPFLERLRDDARQLRYEPADEVVWDRLAARVRDRILLARTPTVAQLLAGWLRPLAASLAALLIVASFAAALVSRDLRDPSAVNIEAAFSSGDSNMTMDDVYGFSD